MGKTVDNYRESTKCKFYFANAGMNLNYMQDSEMENMKVYVALTHYYNSLK